MWHAHFALAHFDWCLCRVANSSSVWKSNDKKHISDTKVTISLTTVESARVKKCQRTEFFFVGGVPSFGVEFEFVDLFISKPLKIFNVKSLMDYKSKFNRTSDLISFSTIFKFIYHVTNASSVFFIQAKNQQDFSLCFSFVGI